MNNNSAATNPSQDQQNQQGKPGDNKSSPNTPSADPSNKPADKQSGTK